MESENASSVSKFSNAPLESVQNGDAIEEEILPEHSEEDEEEGLDFLDQLEKDIETGHNFRRIKMQTEFSESERAEIKKSQYRWKETNEKMFLRHFGQLRDITWLSDQQDYEFRALQAEKNPR